MSTTIERIHHANNACCSAIVGAARAGAMVVDRAALVTKMDARPILPLPQSRLPTVIGLEVQMGQVLGPLLIGSEINLVKIAAREAPVARHVGDRALASLVGEAQSLKSRDELGWITPVSGRPLLVVVHVQILDGLA